MEFTTLFWIMASVVVVISIYIIGGGIIETITNLRSPLRTSPAKVVGKRTEVHGNSDGPVTTTYYITFQFHDGTRMEIPVNHYEYGHLCEGDAGELRYKGTWYKGFSRI